MDHAEQGRADGKALLAKMEADGMAEKVFADGSDQSFAEIVVASLSSRIVAFSRGATEEEVDRYSVGFLEGANEAVMAMRAKLVDGGDELN